MWRNLLPGLSIFFLIAAFLGETYFSHYTGTVIPMPFLFRIASWIIGLIGFCLIFSVFRNRGKSIDKEIAAWKSNLKLNGEKILINLTDCEVKENFYFDEVEKVHSSRAQTYNAMTGQDYRNVEKRSRYATVIIYRYTNSKTGESEKFISPIIEKDKISLGFLLSAKKETFIYIDRNDPGNYFFDLDFSDH
jgi:hypothetical protein